MGARVKGSKHTTKETTANAEGGARETLKIGLREILQRMKGNF